LFRIRRIHHDVLPINEDAIGQVQQILREQFKGLKEKEIAELPAKLTGPPDPRFTPHLFVADDFKGRVRGFALAYHARDLKFFYLHYIASAAGRTGGGVGGALYERVREAAAALSAIGIFLECLPDDPRIVENPEHLAQNRARLKFYERYGARPIVGTGYETPVDPNAKIAPLLVFDPLGTAPVVSRDAARGIVKAILQRVYPHLCSPEYVSKVVKSIEDDPVRIRPLRYVKPERVQSAPPPPTPHATIALVINDKHQIHHIRERGYVEAPVRIKSILEELNRMPNFKRIEPKPFGEKHIRAVHEAGFINYLRHVCKTIAVNKSVYPYVFPIRNASRPPDEMDVRAGYYCIDTFTPLNGNAYAAATRAVDCALTAAQALERGFDAAYALVRPPGHHAEHRSFGGFCYFNSNAVAAHYLSRHGRVAILDIDYHHGNGQQDIFYRRADVLTISIHGHPKFAYPYFTGFEDERGVGPGEGFNVNQPLPEKVDGERYREALAKALRRIREHDPVFLVVALGLDPAKYDPTGTWGLTPRDFESNGRAIGELGYPTLVVQEGGYRTRTLGVNARNFFQGLGAGLADAHRAGAPRPKKRPADGHPPIPGIAAELTFRAETHPDDAAKVRAIVRSTGFFNDREVEVAVELITERLEKGRESGYHFLFAERGEEMVGYACFGPIAGTRESFDLYWIVVDHRHRGLGCGRRLMEQSEARIAAMGGRRVYIETSSTDLYKPTRKFYQKCGYRVDARVKDFYRADDDKIIYVRVLG
jgi:acetoin utilization deacetylase AcuC-like enzyme/GNAT superfamily N-acetyltransferase